MAASKRWMVWVSALATGSASVAFTSLYYARHPGSLADFDHMYTAAKLLLEGRNPYPLIGPGRPYVNRFPLYYPLPAIVLLMPLALVPIGYARDAFLLIAGGAFGYAVASTPGTRWRYSILASRQYLECALLVHWTPLFYAMWSTPALASIAGVKPTVGGAIIAAKGRRSFVLTAVGGAAVLTAISFMLQPRWVPDWLAQVRSADHFSVPLLRPGGFLLVLAILRWRRPEARLLLALAIPPQTPSFYDPLLVFLVAESAFEVMTLVAAGHVLDYVLTLVGPFATTRIALKAVGHYGMWFLYVPALAMVLNRPNVGTAPAWIERIATKLPRWLRGRSADVEEEDVVDGGVRGVETTGAA